MSVQETTQQEQQTTTAESQVEGQATKTDGATLPADGQDKTMKADASQDAAKSEADKAAQDAQDRDDKGRFKGVQPRIDELTRARREAEREAAYWRAIANKDDASSATKAAPEKPTPDKFDELERTLRAHGAVEVRGER